VTKLIFLTDYNGSVCFYIIALRYSLNPALMNRLLYWISVLLIAQSTSAQDSTVRYIRAPQVIIKLAPLSFLLDPDATIQGGLELRTGQRSSVQGEIGLGHKGMSVVSDEKKNWANWSIWRVRSEWRHYTNRYRTNDRKNIHIRSDFPLGNYLAIEGFAKQITGTKHLVFYDPDPNFPTTQSISRFVWGSQVKWGRQIAIPGESVTSLTRLLLDLYIGIGFRYGSNQTTPDDNMYCGCGLIPDRFGQRRSVQPSVAAGLKIGIGL